MAVRAQCMIKVIRHVFIGEKSKDCFGQSGEPEELADHYGLGAAHIAEAAKRVLSRKCQG